MANDVLIDRDWKVVYGSVTIGGVASGTNYHLFRKHTLDLSYPKAVLEFDVLVTGATDAEHTSRVATLKNQFRTPRAKLEVFLGASTFYTYDPSNSVNTGFNAEPSIRKEGSEWDTARSSLWRCRVEVDLPADLSGQAGRRDSQITLRTLDTGQRQIEIVGVYTALTTSAARTQYEAQADTYCATVTTAIDAAATWDHIGPEEAQADDTNKLLRFRRLYEEVIRDETLSGTSATYKNQRLEISVSERATAGGATDSGAKQPIQIVAAYSVSVDKDTNLRTAWVATLLPHVKAQMAASLGGGGLTYVEVTPQFDWARNRIRATVAALSYSGISVLTQTIRRRDFLHHGRVFVPLADGIDHSYHRYDGVKRHRRVLSRTTLRRVGAGADEGASPNLISLLPQGGAEDTGLTEIQPDPGFQILEEDQSTTDPTFIGLPGSQTEIEGVIEVVTMLRVAGAE